jgi:hypothetical protein
LCKNLAGARFPFQVKTMETGQADPSLTVSHRGIFTLLGQLETTECDTPVSDSRQGK